MRQQRVVMNADNLNTGQCCDICARFSGTMEITVAYQPAHSPRLSTPDDFDELRPAEKRLSVIGRDGGTWLILLPFELPQPCRLCTLLFHT